MTTKQKVEDYPEAAERLRALYGGDRANGYVPAMGTAGADGKVRPVAMHKWTRPPDAALWREHLAGKVGIGVIPPAADGKVTFGVIDVDDYTINVGDIAARVQRDSLPVVPVSTKSKGLHLVMFAAEPVDPSMLERALHGVASRLRLRLKDAGGETEIITTANVWMPYCGPAAGRCLVKRGGFHGTLSEFLDRAEGARQTPDQIAALASSRPEPEADEPTGTAADAQVRLKLLIEHIVSAHPGQRNDVLNKSCYEAGGYVGAGYLQRDDVEAQLRAAVDTWYPNSAAPQSDYKKIRDALDKGEVEPLHPRGSGDLITEDAAGLAFAELYRDALMFDHDAGAWFTWTGSHWAREKTQLAFSWARDLARELSAGRSARIRVNTSRVAFAANVERFARADRAFAITSEDWDQDPMLLGTPGGTVDLRTGALRAATPSDRITKVTSVTPSAPADCPLWLKFLRETTRDDPETITFLQRLSGYVLTGDTREQMLTFVYGPGGNGKSVFLSTIAGVMGDYATTAAMETFAASKSDRHPADLAMLRGARLVTASETDEGRAWAETRIKALTGGDKISARFMRQNFFSFTPNFKLMIVGNHQPSLRNVNDAMRRRFAIVPFVNQPEKPDRQLEAKLKGEWPGILRWMIDGCLEWQANGLPRPDTVQHATDSYFEEQDLMGQWIEERCEGLPVGVSPRSTLSGVLYASWVGYAKAAGEFEPGSKKAFGQQMEQRGYERGKDGRGRRVYFGIRLRKVDAGAM